MKLTQGTLVPIGFVVVAVSVGLAWGNISSATKTNAEETERVIKKQDHYNENLERIDRRLARIEGALKVRVPSEDDKTE